MSAASPGVVARSALPALALLVIVGCDDGSSHSAVQRWLEAEPGRLARAQQPLGTISGEACGGRLVQTPQVDLLLPEDGLEVRIADIGSVITTPGGDIMWLNPRSTIEYAREEWREYLRTAELPASLTKAAAREVELSMQDFAAWQERVFGCEVLTRAEWKVLSKEDRAAYGVLIRLKAAKPRIAQGVAYGRSGHRWVLVHSGASDGTAQVLYIDHENDTTVQMIIKANTPADAERLADCVARSLVGN